MKYAHYASYPTALPEWCIKASTSAKGVCATCGAPWARITAATPEYQEKLDATTEQWHSGAGKPDLKSSGFRNITAAYETLGWLPTCDCPATEPAPAVVLDPFSGTASTGIAARRIGRRYVGIDLNAAYIDIALKRLAEGKHSQQGMQV